MKRYHIREQKPVRYRCFDCGRFVAEADLRYVKAGPYPFVVELCRACKEKEVGV